VKLEGRTQFLSAVCMACLEGWGPGHTLRCVHCGTPWDGSSLVLGTMYSYDIFAAMHCCPERSKVRLTVSYSHWTVSNALQVHPCTGTEALYRPYGP